MRRRTTSIRLLFAFAAQLTGVWLALAPGLVVCMEEDGQVAVEASLNGSGCGDTAPSSQHPPHSLTLSAPAADHCDGCEDVPLFLTGDVAAAHPHATTVTAPGVATVPAIVVPASRLTPRQPVMGPARPLARIPSQRSALLRI